MNFSKNAASLVGTILLFLFFIHTGNGQVVSEFDNEELVCKEMHAHRNLFEPMLRSNPLTDVYDLKYYRFEWEIDPAVYAIKGTATPYFKVLGEAINEINFDLAKEHIIDSIMWHGQKLTYSQPAAYQLNIKLPAALPANTLDSISISYHGAPPSSGFGTFVQSDHGGVPILWTLSEPFGSQDWWPCKNGLDDKIDSIDVKIITPEKYRAAGNGLLVEEVNLPDQKKMYHWKHRYAIAPYLVAFAVTNYATFTHDVLLSDGTNMPMLNYVYPENLDNAKAGTLDNVKVLQFYDSLFVSYPFRKEKYGHAQFGWGGGQEHQTMSFVVSFGWGLLSHELAHQWFGDYVTCGQWEDIWLNEGFATYLEGLTRERFQSPNGWRSWKTDKINSITSNPGGSVKVDDPTSVNRIFSSRLSYNKGSYLLHMLRWKLGDSIFFAGLRSYLYDRAYKYAKTTQLKNHLETVSGQNLNEYFNDWFSGQGYPSYTVTWDQKPDRVLIKLGQVSSHSSVSFFEMPVPLRLRGEGKELLVRLDHNMADEIFTVHPDFVVETMEFDPDMWLAAKSTVIKGEIVSSAVNDISNTGMSVFPNPAQDNLTLQINEIMSGPCVWTISDINGKFVSKGSVAKQLEQVNIADLTSGLYQIAVNTNGNKVYRKTFIKI